MLKEKDLLRGGECLDNYEVLDAKTQLTDVHYFLELMAHSPARSLTHDEKLMIIGKCLLAAKEAWIKLQLTDDSSPIPLIEARGYQIVENDEFSELPIFAVCDPNQKSIIVNKKAIEKSQNILDNWAVADERWAVNIQFLVLWHEFFHILEEDDDAIYTRRPILEKYFLGRKRCRPLDCASEIGAIYFSKIATRLAFNPRVFEELRTAVFNV